MAMDVAGVLAQAAHETGIGAQDVDRFTRALLDLPAPQAARINPFSFAEAAGLAPQSAIDLFVLGTRTGIVDLEWGMVCPKCASIMQTAHALDGVAENAMFCQFCQVECESVLDDTVEVSFAFTPPDRPLRLHGDFAAYRHYFTSSAHPLSAFMTEYQNRNRVADLQLGSGERADWDINLDAGEHYRIICLDTHAATDVATTGSGDVRDASLTLSNSGFSTPVTELAPGGHRVAMTNATEAPVWLHLVRIRLEEIAPAFSGGDLQYGPRLTGKDLLNNQTFRDSFALSDLAPDLKLKLRSLTLLFTDLKGSTALYDREGDLAAYRLVQDHFAALREVVRAHSGAVIKTMGDAVMAAFPGSADGARAATKMMGAMQKIAGDRYAGDVGLKVGLHTGPALAINADRGVDYFGQTVNIAARVQGLADEGDICLTRATAGEVGVSGALADAGYGAREEVARLKGVSSEEHILRYRR